MKDLSALSESVREQVRFANPGPGFNRGRAKPASAPRRTPSYSPDAYHLWIERDRELDRRYGLPPRKK